MYTKTFDIPGVRWASVKEFLKDFPELKTSLFIALYPFGDRTWDMKKQVTVHSNAIKYAINKHFPITYTSEINEQYMPISKELRDTETNKLEFKYSISQASSSMQQDIANRYDAHAYIWGGSLGVYGYGLGRYIDIFTEAFYSYIVPSYGGNTLGYSYAVPDLITAYNTIKSHINDIVDNFLQKGVLNFEAYSSEQTKDFNETYNKNLVDVSPYTIIYKVLKEAPPIDASIDWQNVKFWSELFNNNFGLAILQAAAEKYPVRIDVRANSFKEDKTFVTERAIGGVDDAIIRTWYYVYNDFNITVTSDIKILVEYVYERRNYSMIELREIDHSWAEMTKGLIMAVVTIAAAIAAPYVASLFATAAPATPNIVATAEQIALMAPVDQALAVTVEQYALMSVADQAAILANVSVSDAAILTITVPQIGAQAAVEAANIVTASIEAPISTATATYTASGEQFITTAAVPSAGIEATTALIPEASILSSATQAATTVVNLSKSYPTIAAAIGSAAIKEGQALISSKIAKVGVSQKAGGVSQQELDAKAAADAAQAQPVSTNTKMILGALGIGTVGLILLTTKK